ncbi:hypothetical protein IC229_34750 [Spirosoma sp. BT702]|uniref:Uncharacterized protein n=1 Tax=Spirosoma profusum TaxID=2771354 RepID=A0A927AWT5_9BACT|nr:hypothetical protein [Spirosoma profusum]MBD2705811.1 hypothetical protein [Spirosoma profusum]
MKNVLSIIALCLITLSGFAQPVKYSFEEVAYSPGEPTKQVTIYSSDILDDTGAPKYKVRLSIDIKNNKLQYGSASVYLTGPTTGGELCLSTVNHLSHLYLSTPNTGGVEAYGCRDPKTKVVVYFLVGATTSNTLKFLIYEPSGPMAIKL